MDNMKELVIVQKPIMLPIMLDGGNFGHWKARMRHLIRGIDEDAWTAVEDGLSAPTMIMDDKNVGPQPKDRWTDSENSASKFNSKALTVIFSSVDLDQFKIIQGCESAKEAWDTLINHFEGDTSRKGGNRSSGRFQKSDSDRGNSQYSKQDSSKNSKKKELQCHECEGYIHFQNECPLAKRRELKCIECKGCGQTRKSDSEEEELHLNFIALIGHEEVQETHSTTEFTNEEEEEDDNISHDLETEYKALFDKFAELSHENLQLPKDKAMLKAQVNILELEQPSIQTTARSILNEADQEVLSLTRAMAEQERIHKQFEDKFIQITDLLKQEIDKSKLLENQLAETNKKVRMLTIGKKTLDHLLTLGQCPSISTGLVFRGSTSKTTGERVLFMKETSKEEVEQKLEEIKPTGVKRETDKLA
ncbi:hypothetical protein N665_0677s0016 [Sinapis alba]|nr:hypothetical protein N665_0677s0016 [Sinapis alba]